jgi:hypothetical protein
MGHPVRVTDHARLVLRRVQLALGALAVLIGTAAGALAGASAPAAPLATGLTVCAGTVAVCWALLGLAGAVCRRRLADRDSRDWGREWALVEPVWSRRTV